jgi:hypothetical protein
LPGPFWLELALAVEKQLLPARQLLQGVLTLERRGLVLRFLTVDELERPATSRVSRSPAGAMGIEPLVEIVRDARVERAVSAAKEIDAPKAVGRWP